MIKNKLEEYFFIILTGAGILLLLMIPVLAQEIKNNKPGFGNGVPATASRDWNPKNKKQPVVAGVPLGATRSEIMRIFSAKNISPQQRTGPADIFPRLIGEISYIKKAYVFYTDDQASKLHIIFNVPPDLKKNTGESLFGLYRELRKSLVQLYGQPTNTTAYVHPNFPYELVALETGNAYFFDYWENVDDLKILLSLKGQKEEIDFSLTYQYLPLFVEK